MDRARLQTIVRRVVHKSLSTSGSRPRLRGVHVQGGTGLSRPGEVSPQAEVARDASGRILVTAEDIATLANGASFTVQPGAQVTSLAREDAWRRGIQLVEATASAKQHLRVAIGADHGGFPIKEEIKAWLRELGHAPIDLGTHDQNAVDYPDFARAVAETVASGRADMGVCVDGAGIGSSIAANKVPGIRAALCYDEQTAKNAREHNFANVLSLGGPMIGAAMCRSVLEAFLSTPEGAARHARRVDKITSIEARYTGERRSARRVLPEPGG